MVTAGTINQKKAVLLLDIFICLFILTLNYKKKGRKQIEKIFLKDYIYTRIYVHIHIYSRSEVCVLILNLIQRLYA